MPDLAIIIVSWNVRELLQQCLHAVDTSLASSGISYEIFVVDNASSDGTPAMLRAEFPAVRLREAGCNLGFTGGNNLALRELGFLDERRKTKDESNAKLAALPSSFVFRPSAVLLLNPDTAPQGDALPQLVRYLEAHPEVVAVGPQLRYGDGSVQSSRRRFPQRATFFWESTPLERLWTANPWARRYRYAGTLDHLEQRVDWLVGAALLVRSEAIIRAGLLDEGFFMYSEELEWQMRLQSAGDSRDTEGRKQKAESRRKPRDTVTHYALRLFASRIPHPASRIAYLPSAIITHYEGRSSEQVLAGRHLYFQQSKLRLGGMLYGRTFARLLRIFLLAWYCWELVNEAAKWLLGHRRTLRQERIGVYTQVLRGLISHPAQAISDR